MWLEIRISPIARGGRAPSILRYCRRSSISGAILPRYPTEARDFVIGWIGSQSTTRYLVPLLTVLQQATGWEETSLRLVGSGELNLPGVAADIMDWSESSEVHAVQSFTVGIMPLQDDPWARGKCGYKLIQYMACGLPVVASPVGVNGEIVEHGVSGFLADTEAEWLAALSELSKPVAAL